MWTQMSERVGRFVRRFKKSDGGATAVEFALVAFPFISLLGITMETGLLMFTEYTLQASVQDAARLIRTGQAQSAAMSASAFKTKICSTAGIIIDCTGGVTVYVRSDPTFAALRAALPVFTNVGAIKVHSKTL